MKSFVLVKIQLKKLLNEIILSLFDIQVVLSYFLFIVTALFFSFELYVFYFVTISLRNYFIKNIIFKLLHLIFLLIHSSLLFSIYRGISNSYFFNIFESFDLEMMLSYPITPRDLYISKYMSQFLKKIIGLFILFLIIYPLLIYYSFSKIKFICLYISLFLFIEINYFISYIAYNIIYNFNNIMKLILEKKIYIILLIIFFFNIVHVYEYKIIYNIIPSNMLINVLIYLFSKTQNIGKFNILYNILNQIIIYLIFLYISYLISDIYYDLSQQKRYLINFFNHKDFTNNFIFEAILNKNREFIILIKDVYTHIRNYGKNFILQVLIEYLLLFIIFIMKQKLTKKVFLINMVDSNLIFLIMPFTIILILNLFSPSIKVFNNEINMKWFLKSSCINFNKLVLNKLLYSFIFISIYGIPTLISIILLINNMYQTIDIIFMFFNIIFIHTSIGIFISSHNMYNENNVIKKSFLMYYIHIFLTTVVSYFEIASFYINPFFSITILIFLISVSFTKYDSPALYYVFELFSKIYIIAWIIITLYIIIVISTNILLKPPLLINLFNFYPKIMYVLISILTTLVNYRVFSNLTIKNLRDREELI